MIRIRTVLSCLITLQVFQVHSCFTPISSHSSFVVVRNVASSTLQAFERPKYESIFHNKPHTWHRHSLRVELDPDEGLTYDPDGPRINFRARKESTKAVDEHPGHRSLLEYLALPAEKYSVLDAGTITKKEGSRNEFACVLDPIKFLGNEIIAVIDAEVDVSPFPEGKSVIRVNGCTLDGSRFARFANGSFEVDCTNVVRALPEGTGKRENKPVLAVDCSLEISALVPREGRWLPKRLIGKSGSVVMQQMLNILVPRFVDQLSADFDGWSAGDDSRAPVAVRGADEVA